jgi:hypothetical protein
MEQLQEVILQVVVEEDLVLLVQIQQVLLSSLDLEEQV